MDQLGVTVIEALDLRDHHCNRGDAKHPPGRVSPLENRRQEHCYKRDKRVGASKRPTVELLASQRFTAAGELV